MIKIFMLLNIILSLVFNIFILIVFWLLFCILIIYSDNNENIVMKVMI